MEIIEAYKNIMEDIGLAHPLARATFFGSIGFAIQYFIKPSISYASIKVKGGGNKSAAKEFKLTSKANPPMTTYFPWYLWPAAFALFGAFVL